MKFKKPNTHNRHTNPRVSVVMSTYNDERYVARAVDSILSQSFADFEFIIINDGSTDNTLKILRSYDDPRIVLISRPNKGLSASLKEGAEKSRGKYIARQDADDISMKERLAEQVVLLEKNSDVGLVGTYFQHIDVEGDILENIIITPSRSMDLKARMLFSNAFGHGTTMFRKEVFEEVGGYRSDYGAVEDFDLWRRFVVRCKVVNLPKVLYLYRINPEGIIANIDDAYTENLARIFRENRVDIKDTRTYPDLVKSAIAYRFLSAQYRKEQFRVFISDQWHILPVLIGLRQKRQAMRLMIFLFTVTPFRAFGYVINSVGRRMSAHA